MEDGIIELDTERGKEFGFTSDKFSGYLWKHSGYIYISFIESLDSGNGNLSRLFDKIIKKGIGIKVPTPFPKMESICMNKGFKKTQEFFPEAKEDCDVWVKDIERKGNK